MKEVYVSVDIEAAGPIPGTYSLLSIGACVVGRAEEKFYVELQPINGAFIKAALDVAGKSLDEFSISGEPPQSAMSAFQDWIQKVTGEGTPVFIGFNASFDWSFINWYFHTYLNINPFGIGGVDIKSFYMGMSGCSWKDTRSSHIPNKFKGSSPHTHNALDDAVEQGEMFNLMLGALSKSKRI